MMADGARNLTDERYQLKLPLTRTPSIFAPRHEQHIEFQFLHKWISDEFLTDCFFVPLNKVLNASREHHTKTNAEYRHRAKIAEFWKWLAMYFAEHLIMTKEMRQACANLVGQLCSCMGKCRYKSFNAAMMFSDDGLKNLLEQFNKVAANIIRRGNAVTIDETLIAYFGHDAKQAGIWRRIAEKPHPKGLIQWRAVSTLRHSNRRIILCIVPCFPWQQHTPVNAASEIIARLQKTSNVGLHVFLDAGFASLEMFQFLQANDLAFTICIKSQFTGPFGPLYRVANNELPAGSVRSYEYKGHIVQAISKPKDSDHTSGYATTVVSNDYNVHTQDNVRFARRGPYSSAVDDFLESHL